MRARVVPVLLVVVLATLGCGPTVDLSTSLEVTDVATGWHDAGVIEGKNKLVPAITFKLKNNSDQSLTTLQVNALFRRVNEPDEWGSGYLKVTGSDGLAPGARTGRFDGQFAAWLYRHPSLARSCSATTSSSTPRWRFSPSTTPPSGPVWQSSRSHDSSKSAERAVTVPVSTPASLERRLGPLDGAAVVVSNVIGGGILFTPPLVAAAVPLASLFLATWLIGGLLAFAGAMAYAELAALRPRAGGEYVYLRAAFGKLAAFLTGWTSFVAGFSGAMATSAVVLTAYLGRFLPSASDGSRS